MIYFRANRTATPARSSPGAARTCLRAKSHAPFIKPLVIRRAIANTEAYAVSRRERKKVEMLFAHLKRILRLDRLRLRGPSGAKDEFLLAATAQNLRKLAKLIPSSDADIRHMRPGGEIRLADAPNPEWRSDNSGFFNKIAVKRALSNRAVHVTVGRIALLQGPPRERQQSAGHSRHPVATVK